MSGTALDHRLVRDYLRELDAAMRGLPPAQARELREQITAHLDDALPPDAGDQEVAETLSRLGSPAGLAAEAANGSSGPRLALSSRVRWRLAAVIAVPTAIAAVLGGPQISGDAGSYVTSGRVQQLARLNAAVVKLTQNLEDERDLSATSVARKEAGSLPAFLVYARTATDAAASTVRADAAGVGAGAGYQRSTVWDLQALLKSIALLGNIRKAVSFSATPASMVIQTYTDNVILPANTFSAAVGGGTGDASLQGTVTTLAALLRVENDQSVQRAILSAALSAQPPVLAPEGLASLQQAAEQQIADLTDFNASASATEQQLFSNTVSGAAVDLAGSSEELAEQAAATHPSAPLTGNSGLAAATWYSEMSTTIGDTRKVTGQLTGQITARANTLKSNATYRLLLTSIVTLALLLLVLLTSAALALSLTRPSRRPQPGRLDARIR
jgi:hypothetical protein